MRLIRNILIGLGLLVAVLAAAAYALPRVVTVERSIVIESEASAIFPYLNSLQQGAEWSPWLGKDPEAQLTYSGPSEGVGNTLAWASDHPQVGNGVEVITESIENQRVVSDLDFGDMGTAIARFDLEEVGGGTQITWGLDADMGNNPIGRWMGLMMDKWVGADYEQGLTNLKAVVEG